MKIKDYVMQVNPHHDRQWWWWIEENETYTEIYTVLQILTCAAVLGAIVGACIWWYSYTEKKYNKRILEEMEAHPERHHDVPDEWFEMRKRKLFERAYAQTKRWAEAMCERLSNGEPILPTESDEDVDPEEWAWYDDYMSFKDPNEEDEFPYSYLPRRYRPKEGRYISITEWDEDDPSEFDDDEDYVDDDDDDDD